MDADRIVEELLAVATGSPAWFGAVDEITGAALDGTHPILICDTWVYSSDLTMTVLVRHPERGWVMPGGRVEPGETFRAAARRELHEETGITVGESDLSPVALHTGRDSWSGKRRWAISYSVTVPPDTALEGEPRQPAQWWPLDQHWQSVFPHDRERLHINALRLQGQPSS